jgi:hypothetical protein
MTCPQLGGAWDLAITGETFKEVARLSQNHGTEMFAANDPSHIEAMNKMMEIMKLGEMDLWMNERQAEFDRLP